jgi:ankyrin repeat protein
MQALLETKDKDDYTPFHKAVSCKKSQRTPQYLQEMGADIEAVNRKHQTPLQAAIEMQDDGLIFHLLGSKANPMISTGRGVSFLDAMDIPYLKILVEYIQAGLSQNPYERASIEDGIRSAIRVYLRTIRMIMSCLDETRSYKHPPEFSDHMESREELVNKVMKMLQRSAQRAATTYSAHSTIDRVEDGSEQGIDTTERERSKQMAPVRTIIDREPVDNPLDITTEDALISATSFASHGYPTKVFRMHWICVSGAG